MILRPERLTKDGIASGLEILEGWQLTENREAICKEYRFSSFTHAFAFMTACAIEAEKLDHHPEWKNVYNRVSVTLVSHDVNGLTSQDFQLAAIMDKHFLE